MNADTIFFIGLTAIALSSMAIFLCLGYNLGMRFAKGEVIKGVAEVMKNRGIYQSTIDEFTSELRKQLKVK